MVNHLIYNIYISFIWFIFWIGAGVILLLFSKPLNIGLILLSIIFFTLSLFPIFMYFYNKRQVRKIQIYIVN